MFIIKETPAEILSAIVEDHINGMGVVALTKKYHANPITITKYLKQTNSLIPKTIPRDREDAILADYLAHINIDTILEKYNVSNTSLYRILKRNNVDSCHVPLLTQEEKKRVSELYLTGVTVSSIAEDLKVASHLVYKYLHNNNESRPLRQTCLLKHNSVCRRECFTDTDEEGCAYWIGFCLGDSCVTGGRLQTGLKHTDWNHLEKFCDYLALGKDKVKTTKTKLKGKVYLGCVLTISDPVIVEKVRQFGLTERKSGKEQVPDCYKHNRHFWRGFWDAEGSVSYLRKEDNSHQKNCRFIGSASVLADLTSALTVVTQDFSDKTIQQESGGMASMLIRRKEGKLWLDHLYKDATIYLDRKYKAYKEIWCKDEQENQQ